MPETIPGRAENEAAVGALRGMASVTEFYHSLFEIRLAETPEDVRASQALRYRVYCEETDFLRKEDNPGGLETDECDYRSVAILLIHRATGDCVGTVRIVLPDAQLPGAGQPARQMSGALNDLKEVALPVATTGEISRFTIAPEFRRRAGDTLYPQIYSPEELGDDARRVIPNMALGLFAGIMQTVIQYNLTHLCAIIDPALLRLLRRLYIEFEKVGPQVDFHGRRQPVITSCLDLYTGLQRLPPELLKIINFNGALEYHPPA